MKEIDINIEGYNVNGICVGCLNYNRKMFYHEDIKECFFNLADIDIPDGLSVQLCWECLASVRRACQFRTQLLKSYDILISYSRQHTFLNSPTDFTQHATTRLSLTKVHTNGGEIVQPMLLKEDIEEKAEVKLELGNEPAEFEPPKSEDLMFEQDDIQLDDFSQDVDPSSEDDVQLSKLKQKKEKKKVKKRRKSVEKPKPAEKPQTDPQKKLKNLPPDLVEVYNMSEEEMWSVRSEDQDNKYLSRLRFKCLMCLMTFNSEKHEAEHMAGKHRPKGEDCLQCDVCKAFFLTKDHLSAHRNLHLIAYRCKECGVKTSVKAVIRKHIKVHQCDVKEFQCKTCEKAFNSRSKLSYHRSKYHKEKLQCDCCGKVFASKMTLKYHIKVLAPNKEDKPKEKLNIPCKGCNKVFHSKKSYRAHVVIHNGITYPCPICGKLFQWKRNLARHTRNHRERDAGALHECRECGKTFSSRDCYNNHMKLSKRHVPEDAYVYAYLARHTRNHREREAGALHECRECGKTFSSSDCYNNHMKLSKRHVPEDAYVYAYLARHTRNHREREAGALHECRECGKTFSSSDCYNNHMKLSKKHVPEDAYVYAYLARHTRNHKEREAGALHECRECGKTFSSSDCYNNHMKSKRHVPEDAYVHECNYCGKKFATKWCMVDHIDWDHLKVIKYQCSVCFKAFKTAKIMVAHMNNIHEGKRSKEPEGEHLCEVCGKSYKTVKRLKGHVWAMHTNRSSSKNFKCKLCPATFAWQTSIYKHMKMMHDNKRSKQSRLQSVKKQEPYPDIEPATRMQYFQPNSLVQNIVLVSQPTGVPHVV